MNLDASATKIITGNPNNPPGIPFVMRASSVTSMPPNARKHDYSRNGERFLTLSTSKHCPEIQPIVVCVVAAENDVASSGFRLRAVYSLLALKANCRVSRVK